MLKSMTGFGKSMSDYNSKKVSVEIRALNSKSMDINTRIPSCYKELENELRKLVSAAMGRGKVDFSISIDSIGGRSTVSINRALAKTYYNDLKAINEDIGEKTEDYLSVIMRMPEILNSNKETVVEQEKNWLLGIVADSLANLNAFRRKEGKELEQEYAERINDIRELLKGVSKYEKERTDTIRERMRKAIDELQTGTVDENRLEQEMIFYIEKLDVSEEKMRLSNHLDYFEETMKTEMSGKKLGFIGQEIGREINTLGSKSNHAEMQKLVIGMKDHLEKIKEQILNTL
jgi:uncharacterized protein (TIGR00255 family)